MIYRLLAFLLLSSTAFSQITTEAETRYRVDGIQGWQIVEDVVFAPKDSKPKLVAVGWVTVDSEAAIIKIKAETEKRVRLEVKQFTSNQFAVLGTGKIWIDVTAVDFEKQIFDQNSFVIEVEGSPDPEPEPPDPEPEPEPDDSEVPEDKFDNLGQRIDSQATADNLQLDLRNRHAEIYETASKKMEDRQLVRTADVKAYVQTETAKLTRDTSWTKTVDIITKSANDLSPLSWADTILWYKAVAAGLRGGR